MVKRSILKSSIPTMTIMIIGTAIIEFFRNGITSIPSQIQPLFTGSLIGFIFFIVPTEYYRLISLKNQLRNSYREVNVKILKRHESIIDLNDTAKSYTNEQQELLNHLAKESFKVFKASKPALRHVDQANSIEQLNQSENSFKNLLKSFYAIPENKIHLKNDPLISEAEEKIKIINLIIPNDVCEFNKKVEMYNAYREEVSNSLCNLMNFKKSLLLDFKD